MSLIENYRLTWGDYFSMNSQTYDLKRRIVHFKDHWSDPRIGHPINIFRICKIDYNELEREVLGCPVLQLDGTTLPLLADLKKRIDNCLFCAIYGHYDHKDDSDYSGSWDNLASFDCSGSSSSASACSDSLWWPTVIHVPTEIEVHLPEPPSNEPNPDVPDDPANGS